MLDFILPTEQNEFDVLSFYDEFDKHEEKCIGIGNYKNYKSWLKDKRNRHDGKNLPDGFVRENFYLCYENGRLVGVSSLKFELSDYLLNFGGHVGYAVRPSDRKCGLATQILKQSVEIAKSFGFNRILCVCDDDNIASEKVILKNGGVLENEVFDESENVTVKRFWIDV